MGFCLRKDVKSKLLKEENKVINSENSHPTIPILLKALLPVPSAPGTDRLPFTTQIPSGAQECSLIPAVSVRHCNKTHTLSHSFSHMEQ